MGPTMAFCVFMGCSTPAGLGGLARRAWTASPTEAQVSCPFTPRHGGFPMFRTNRRASAHENSCAVASLQGFDDQSTLVLGILSQIIPRLPANPKQRVLPVTD